MNDSVSVIINVFNEAETIENEILKIYSIIILSVPNSELIIAEDGSTDGTHEIILKIINQYPNIKHSTSTKRKGYLNAFKDAVILAKNKWIFFSDTGGKNNFNEFFKLYEIRDQADLIIGFRNKRTDQYYRRFLTWSFNYIICKYFNINISDADSGFRLYNSFFLKEIINRELIFKNLINSEIAIRLFYMGGIIKEVPVTYMQRIGVSRGLPLKKIPSVIVSTLMNLSYLKKNVIKLKYKDNN